MAIEIKKEKEIQEDGYTAIQCAIMMDGKEVGVCNVLEDADYAYCESIAIYEDERNQGYGTAALYELSSMYGGIVVAPDNTDAKRLYGRLGSEWSGEDAPYIDQGYGVYEI